MHALLWLSLHTIGSYWGVIFSLAYAILSLATFRNGILLDLIFQRQTPQIQLNGDENQRNWMAIKLMDFWAHACVSSALTFSLRPAFVYLGLLGSRIPQFITSLEHPYVKNNQYALEAHSDLKEALCGPESQLEAWLPPAPDDLFQRISLNNKDWTYTEKVLSEVLDCPMALGSLEELRVKALPPSWGGKRPTEQGLILLTSLLKNTSQLKTLSWASVQSNAQEDQYSAIFKKYFAEQDLYLPSVTEMELGPNMEFFVPMAPQLQSLISTPYFSWACPCVEGLSSLLNGPQWRLIKSLGVAKHLKEFKFRAKWTTELLEKLHREAPSLEKLTLEGDLSAGNCGSTGRNRLKKNLVQLAKFENLTELNLPATIWLGVGDSPTPPRDVINVYVNFRGIKAGRRELLEEIRDTEVASSIAAGAIPQLKKICVHRSCAKIQKGKEMKWPWTGRLKSYVLDVYPRFDGNDPFSSRPDRKEEPDDPVLMCVHEDAEWFREDEDELFGRPRYPPYKIESRCKEENLF